MASPGGYLLEDAHSCPICQQIVVDVGERYQSHDLAKLGAGAPPDERESCELYRQVSRAREDAPDVHLHLQIVRFKSRTSPLTAIIRNGRRDFDPDEVDLGYTYHVYADEGILMCIAGRLTNAANRAHCQATWQCDMCRIASREWMYHQTESSKLLANGCDPAYTATSAVPRPRGSHCRQE